MSDWPVRLVFALRWKDFTSLAIEKGKENLQEVFDRVKWLILAVEYLKGFQGRSIRHQNVCVCSCMSCFFTVVIPTALDKNGALIVYHTLVILFPINTSIESYSSQVLNLQSLCLVYVLNIFTAASSLRCQFVSKWRQMYSGKRYE